LDLSALDDALQGEPKYRHKQAMDAVFKNHVSSWDQASNLPRGMIQRLADMVPLDIEAQVLESADGRTTKALLKAVEGSEVETVLMRHGGRNTVCVSTQVGCPIRCGFCVTGSLGYDRNLSRDEILAQVLLFSRTLAADNERVSNVVFMGMGEPLLNYEAVLEAVRFLNRDDAFGIGIRRISISTIGLTEGIHRLAREELGLNLAVSLHAPHDGLRQQLIPVAASNPLVDLLAACEHYFNATGRKIMYEYTLIDGINDSTSLAADLAALLRGRNCVVNLIRCNPGVPGFEPSSGEVVQQFKDALESKGINVTQRWNYGSDISAACGQLRASRDEP